MNKAYIDECSRNKSDIHLVVTWNSRGVKTQPCVTPPAICIIRQDFSFAFDIGHLLPLSILNQSHVSSVNRVFVINQEEIALLYFVKCFKGISIDNQPINPIIIIFSKITASCRYILYAQ